MFYACNLFKALLQVPELSTVGTAQERAAFIALRIDGRTVREAGELVGVSKSHVTNLADRFQAKLIKRMMELRRKPTSACSAEYRKVCGGLYERLCELRDFGDDWGDYKIGNFKPDAASQEDWAEMRGMTLKFEDE
ncbi:MAG TPA: helix-turn-helix domain-containing protein [Candidatus Acidoferrales bacterium]|jgi:hypothetical protein|nr:helix-turn-helix domain-containing protein [Candidatus Acidoferrales bacterium]